MQRVFSGLRLWFYRYFIGYGEYRYSRTAAYYRSLRTPARTPLRPVSGVRSARPSSTTLVPASRRPASRGVA